MIDSIAPRRLLSPAEIAALAALCLLVYFLTLVTYNHLGEDAFISYRYTRNLVAGHGLVYNPGEWVEGYSNLLWVLLLAPFEALGIRLHIAARLLSAAFHGAIIVGAYLLARRLLPGELPPLLRWWLPVAVLAEPLLHYHLDRGLETVSWVSLQALALFALGAGASPWLAGAFAACVVWSRPEGIGFALALAPAAFWLHQSHRGIPLPTRQALLNTGRYLLLPVVFCIAQLLFRRVAYGSWVPNTVVAKSGGMFASIREIMEFVASHAFWPLAGLAGLVLGYTRSRFRVLSVAGLCLVLAGLLFRLVAGDQHNTGFRYLIPVLVPCLAGLWILLVLLAGGLVRRLDFRPPPCGHRRFPVVLLACLFLVPVPVMPVDLDTPGSFFRGNTNAPRSRLLNRLMERESWNLRQRWEWFLSDPVFINADAGRWVAAHLPPDAVIGADQIGQFGYHAHPGQTIIDVLGLTDATIARRGLDAGYLGERGVDYLVIEVCLDIPLWPRDWRLQPHVHAVRHALGREDFAARFRPRYLLETGISYMAIGFMVYVSEEVDDGGPWERVRIGPDEEEFDRLWRVR